MLRLHSSIDWPRLWYALLGIGAAVYFLGFFAAIEVALGKLAY